MPGPYAFGSQTTQPYGYSPDAFGGFGSPYDQFIHQQISGPGNGAIDPVTGLPAATPKPVTPAAGYTASPQPTTGNNAFGYIPGQLGLPNPAGDLGAQIPGLQGINSQASGVLTDWLGGRLSPDIIRNNQNIAARFGVSSGMPGSGLASNKFDLSNILTADQLQQRGLAAYNSLIPTISSTQTVNPALQTQISEQNAVNAAAPDPTMAASYAKKLYDQYLTSLARTGRNVGPSTGYRGGGPAGGTGSYSGGGPTNFLPHLNDNLSYTPGAFDFSNQFSGDAGGGYGGGSQTTDYGILPQSGQQPLQFDSFGVPQLDMSSGGYGTQYPNYVQDWNSIPAPSDTIDWFGG